MSSHCFLEGANIYQCAFVEGQMSTHAIFHKGGGADVRGDVRLPISWVWHIKNINNSDN